MNAFTDADEHTKPRYSVDAHAKNVGDLWMQYCGTFGPCGSWADGGTNNQLEIHGIRLCYSNASSGRSSALCLGAEPDRCPSSAAQEEDRVAALAGSIASDPGSRAGAGLHSP